MSSKLASAKPAVVLAAIAVALAASLLCGVQPAWADSVQYAERSWDGMKVVSEAKTAECTPITSGTVDIGGETPGWYVVNGDVENDNRLVVEQRAEANIILADGSKLTLEKGINVHRTSKLNINPCRSKQEKCVDNSSLRNV